MSFYATWDDYLDFLVNWLKPCAHPAELPCFCETWLAEEEYKRGTTS
jgi:hypothetical protein